MKKLVIGLLTSLCSLTIASAQQQNLDLGAWRAHVSHSSGLGLVAKDGLIYTATTGGIFSFSPADQELSVYSTVDGMSNITPTAIYHAEDRNEIFLGYEDGSIDFFENVNSFQYLTDIARSTTFPDKRINTFWVEDDRLYVGTNFGIVIYDLAVGLPITDISQIGSNASRTPVVSISVFDGDIWAVMSNGTLFKAPVDFPNLKDPTIWAPQIGLDGLPVDASIQEVSPARGYLYARGSKTLYRRSTDDIWEVEERLNRVWNYMFTTKDAIGVGRVGEVQVINNQDTKYIYFPLGGVTDGVIAGETDFFHTTQFRGLSWFADYEISYHIPNGPRNNDCVQVSAGNGEVYVAPQGYDQVYNPILSFNGVYYYNRSNGWQDLNQQGVLPSSQNSGFARAYYDADTRIAYMGSWGTGLVTLQDGALLQGFTCENSGIPVIDDPCNLDNKVNSRVSGVDFDLRGNMWVSLDFARPPLVVRTPAGDWNEVPNFKFPSGNHIIEMITDDWGSVWMVDLEQGILVYTDNGTPDDFTDGRLINLRRGLNQGNLPTNEVLTLAKDLDGFIWVGTTQGVVVYYDPANISLGNIVDASTPVFDQTGLLSNNVVRAIAVDGGNRKWIGTENGVFLVAENGDDVIFHFTKENSPLLSNRVNDVAVDQSTGEVFIATDKGLISYQGDATLGDRDCSDVLVYPNPVRPTYQGAITIRGAARGSTVKITTISGFLVKEIESQGSTAIWDGLDTYGNPVRSGIYLALIADNNGEKACIGKFSVIR